MGREDIYLIPHSLQDFLLHRHNPTYVKFRYKHFESIIISIIDKSGVASGRTFNTVILLGPIYF